MDLSPEEKNDGNFASPNKKINSFLKSLRSLAMVSQSVEHSPDKGKVESSTSVRFKPKTLI
jgi:hypothetical protein